MGRALWIAFTVIFTSLLLYLAFVGHRERVAQMTAFLPNVVSGITRLVDYISLPSKNHTTGQEKTPETNQSQQKAEAKIPLKPLSTTDVALSKLEYGPDGQLILVGTAGQGNGLDFSIDGVAVDSEILTSNGTWKLVVPKAVLPGQHKLEVLVSSATDGSKTVVVVPFVKARPEEIAALAASRQVPGTEKSLDEPEMSAPKKPSFSKLAKLARSQSVKTDTDVLTGLLPQLMIGDGPSLVTPQLGTPDLEPNRPKIALKPQKPEWVEPQLQRLGVGPELVMPQSQGEKPERKSRTQPLVAKKAKTKQRRFKKVVRLRRRNKAAYSARAKVRLPRGRGLFVVQPGNTLWDLAISIYGSGHYYRKLYYANWRSIRNPNVIYPGQVIYAPGANPPKRIKPISPPQWSPRQ